MCGIVGFISKGDDLFTKEKQHFMHFGLTLDTLRGYDSTGIISVSERFKVTAAKSLMAGDKYVHSQHYKNNNHDAWAKIGHNRAATAGTVSLPNAHPFTFGAVTLVHNGTLCGDGQSIKTYNKDFAVDSMQIAYALSEAKPEEAKAVLKTIDGSFAIVWTDTRDESINMARNSDRPLHFTRNTQNTIMWFMSDPLHLKSINKSLWKTPADGNQIFQMDKMKICKFKKGSLVPEVTAFDPFIRPVVQTRHYVQRDTGTSKTALEIATERWERATKLSGLETKPQENGGGLSLGEMRIKVNNRERKLLLTHVKILKSDYDLYPGLPRCFFPITKYKQNNGRYTVLGDMLHTDWGNCEMDAIVYDVPPALANSYMRRGWTVNPTGVSRPHVFQEDKDSKLRFHSIVCSLINCDWENSNPYEDEVPMEETPDPKALSLSLISVGDSKMYSDKYLSMAEDGCIQCGASLDLEDADTCVVVNGGHDLLCGGCVATLNNFSSAKNPRSLLT
jgi:hypothetical protein